MFLLWLTLDLTASCVLLFVIRVLAYRLNHRNLSVSTHSDECYNIVSQCCCSGERGGWESMIEGKRKGMMGAG